MKQLFYKPLFWLSFLVASGASAFLAFHYFPLALSIIHVPITMDRQAAITQATLIAQTRELSPTGKDTAANFQTDYLVQFFVELDAGGKQAFVAMMEQDLYQPYTWQVRFFKQHDPEETTIVFTSDGKPYGFTQKLSENRTGAQLTVEQARAIAEQGALQWGIDLSAYKPIEASKEVVASGRLDHTFVYERPEIKIGDGFYRLRLRVSGEKLTELTHFVQVPETFIRKYTEMRSANDAIRYYAKIALILLYFLGCCLFGLFFLMRRRYILWRAPIIWGLLFTLLMIGTALNQLPLAWSHYDTAVSAMGYLVQYIVSILINAIQWGIFFTIIFAAAESLTRYAFGNKIQLWSMWDKGIANSYQVLGRTVAGYLVVPILLAYAILFYFIMNSNFGWWSPASALFDPNVLATYLPWFDALSQSICAGFWEECMFRAVPLSCAAIIGTRLGKRTWWIAGAFILQAVIFGAGHAHYATQPAIARMIELIIPSFIFGGLYLAFGLMPAIISHITFDIFWFALPLFIASGHQALINQAIVILGALIPLIILLARRWQQGAWIQLSPNALNRAWQAPADAQELTQETVQEFLNPLSSRTNYLFIAAGLVGIIAWYAATPHTQQAHALPIERASALQRGQTAFAQLKVDHTKPWNSFATVRNPLETTADSKQQHRFIWQQGGAPLYQELLSSYLQSPYWLIRFAQFDGPLADRAEEVWVAVNEHNQPFRTIHHVPEAREGKELSEEDARALAHAEIKNKFGIDALTLKEISATATKRPSRKDWTFIFADESHPTMHAGQLRIEIGISGDMLTEYQQFVHLPEEWERTEKDNDNIRNIIMLLCMALVYVIFCAGCFFAALGWSNKLPLGRSFILFFIGIFGLELFDLFNNYNCTLATTFNTSQPFQDQFIRTFGSLLFKSFFVSATLALIIAYVNRFKITTRLSRTIGHGLTGLGVGALLAGVQAIVMQSAPALKPLWAHYENIAAWSPILGGISSYLMTFITIALLNLLLFAIIHFINKQTRNPKLISIIILLLFGIALSGMQFADNFTLFITYGITTGIFYFCAYYLLFRFDPALIPLATAGYLILQIAQQGMYHAFHGVPYITISSAIIILIMSWCWYKKLN